MFFTSITVFNFIISYTKSTYDRWVLLYKSRPEINNTIVINNEGVAYSILNPLAFPKRMNLYASTIKVSGFKEMKKLYLSGIKDIGYITGEAYMINCDISPASRPRSLYLIEIEESMNPNPSPRNKVWSVINGRRINHRFNDDGWKPVL